MVKRKSSRSPPQTPTKRAKADDASSPGKDASPLPCAGPCAEKLRRQGMTAEKRAADDERRAANSAWLQRKNNLMKGEAYATMDQSRQKDFLERARTRFLAERKSESSA